MSKVFYDHLILIDEVWLEVKSLDVTDEEKQELCLMIDEIMHHRVMTHILDHLTKDHHEEFLQKFYASPHDLSLLEYIDAKIEADIKSELALLGKKIRKELKKEIKKHQKKK